MELLTLAEDNSKSLDKFYSRENKAAMSDLDVVCKKLEQSLQSLVPDLSSISVESNCSKLFQRHLNIRSMFSEYDDLSRKTKACIEKHADISIADVSSMYIARCLEDIRRKDFQKVFVR